MRAPGCERKAHAVGEGEQALSVLGLHVRRVREVLPPAGADLDLRVDQLTRRRDREQIVLAAGLDHRREFVRELERIGVEDRELLLEPDGEILGGFEDLPRASEVEPRVLAHRWAPYPVYAR